MSQSSTANRNNLEKSYQTTIKIVLIQIFSAIILIAVGWFLASGVDNSVSPSAITGLWMTLIFIVILSLVLSRVLYNWQRLKKTFETGGIEGILKLLQQNAVILIALGQIIVVNGFLIATLSVNKIEMFRAGAIALVVFWFNFPRQQIWEKIVTSLEKA